MGRAGVLFAVTMALGVASLVWKLHHVSVLIPHDRRDLHVDFDRPQLEAPALDILPKAKINSTSTANVNMRHQLLNLSILQFDDAVKDYEIQHSQQSNYSVDILIIGSLHQKELPVTQMETWASHTSRRHFIMATEQDAPDPNCMHEMKDSHLQEHVKQCKSRGNKRYRDLGGKNNSLATYWATSYARYEWLQRKRNPAGWVCAQPRFGYAFVKLMKLYEENQNFPDYLVLADDDLYLDMDAFTNEYLITPSLQKKNQKPEDMLIPPPSIPTVWAGCRIRPPLNKINFTFPFGGYGTFFSREALKRMATPLYCNQTDVQQHLQQPKHPYDAVSAEALFQSEACERMKPGMTTMGEVRYYKPGMSIRDLILAYMEQEKRFCAHSDWFLAYFVNYYNVSRHTVTQKLYPRKPWRFDDFMGNVPESRMHTISYKTLDDSEIYRTKTGNCIYNGKVADCHEHAKICHYATTTIMKTVFEAKMKNLPSRS